MRLLASTVFLGLLGTTSCVGAGDPPAEVDDLTGANAAPSAEEAKACASASVGTNSAGDKVVLCHKPFADAPFVRLPADGAPGATQTFYAGVTLPTDVSGSVVLWTRDGSRYVPVDSAGAAISFTGTKLPKALHAPTNRATYTLYQFTGKPGNAIDSSFGAATAIKLSSARAVVSIDGCALDTRLLGTWEGSVSERLASPQGTGPFVKAFDPAKRVPIRIQLTSAKKANPLADYKPPGKLTDAHTMMLEGAIENWDHDVTEGGKKFPSLQAMGKKNPFLGASTGAVELYRLGNMHGVTGDGHWVFTYPAGSLSLTTNAMSFTLTGLTAPTLLFDEGVSDPEISSLDLRPHIPYTSNGHVLLLTPVAIGQSIAACAK